MTGCSDCGNAKFDGASRAYKHVLWIVIAINALMFVVEMAAGVAADSVALQADALDFLGDTLTYTITLLVIGHALRWRATAALFKGVSLAAMGVWVLGSTAYQVMVLGVPNEMVMGVVGLVAFAANVVSALLLLRFRDGDSNVRSVWLCSRNDAIGNLAVILAAAGVFATGTGWPDLVVAAIMASLFLHSATKIVRQAIGELRQSNSVPVGENAESPT